MLPEISKYVRPTKDQYMKLFDSNQRVTDSDGNMCTAVKYLRPLKLQMAAEATDGNELDSYRLLHQEKVNYMYSDSGSRHNKLQPRCPGIPVVDFRYDIQVGLCWKQRTKCPKCNYLSPYYECYKTIKQKKPGPDPADTNLLVNFVAAVILPQQHEIIFSLDSCSPVQSSDWFFSWSMWMTEVLFHYCATYL